MTCNNEQRPSANHSDRAKSVWPHNVIYYTSYACNRIENRNRLKTNNFQMQMNRFDGSDAGNSARKATAAVGVDYCTSTLREYSNGSVGVQCCRNDNGDLLKKTFKNTPRRLDKAVENNVSI